MNSFKIYISTMYDISVIYFVKQSLIYYSISFIKNYYYYYLPGFFLPEFPETSPPFSLSQSPTKGRVRPPPTSISFSFSSFLHRQALMFSSSFLLSLVINTAASCCHVSCWNLLFIVLYFGLLEREQLYWLFC